MSKSRAYAITLNNPTEEEITTAKTNSKASYILVAKEVGKENGLPHLQIYVRFPNAVALSSIKKWLPRCHAEPAAGTPEDNFMYCTKGEGYRERLPGGKWSPWFDHGLNASFEEIGQRPCFQNSIEGIMNSFYILEDIYMELCSLLGNEDDEHMLKCTAAFRTLHANITDVIRYYNCDYELTDSDEDIDMDEDIFTPSTDYESPICPSAPKKYKS